MADYSTGVGNTQYEPGTSCNARKQMMSKGHRNQIESLMAKAEII